MNKPNQLNPINIKGKSQTYSDFYTYNISPAESDKFIINYEKVKEELLKLKTEVKSKGQELLHLKIETAEGENELYNNLRAVERIINICGNSVQKEINQFFEKKLIYQIIKIRKIIIKLKMKMIMKMKMKVIL